MTRSIAALCVPALTLALASAPRSALAQEVRPLLPQRNESTQEVQPPLPQATESPRSTESDCANRQDEDADGLVDCADADCFDDERCHAGGGEERTDRACSDWVDNDGDQMVDCEDSDCQVPSLTVCRGSFGAASSVQPTAQTVVSDELPELGEGQSVEDLIGTGGDNNGERTDETCADGIDNDFDGRMDCADFGCRFDPQVTVCNGTPGLRFSVVAGAGLTSTWRYDLFQGGVQLPETVTHTATAGFTQLQLRALGPIPFIENSFFLVNVNAINRVRITFALFQVPLGNLGHYLQINSGFGALSTALVISAARHPLLEPAFYLVRAFEQGNGAMAEVGGPIDTSGIVRFRAFAAAGSGESTGNIGGRFFRSEERNFSYAAGASFQVNIFGYFDRLDTPFIYTPVPLTWAIFAGAKYDQRPAERYVQTNGFTVFQLWHFGLRIENNTRYILDDPMTVPIQTSVNAMLFALIYPRVFAIAADGGGVWQTQAYSPGAIPTDPEFRRQLNEAQWRVGIHWYAFRQTGILSAVYGETYFEENLDNPSAPEVERELKVNFQYRF